MNTLVSWANDPPRPRNSGRRLVAPGIAAALLAAALGWAPAPACAQGPAKGGTAAAPAATQPAVLELWVGRSTVVPTPWPVKRVYATDVNVATVGAINAAAVEGAASASGAPEVTTQVLVQGKAPGSTDVFVWSDKGEMLQFRVDVKIDLAAIKAQIAKLFPDCQIEVGQSGQALVLSGVLAKAEEAEQVHNYFGTMGIKYVDLTTVAGLQQVQLKVVVAEASRTAIRALGINAVSAGSSAFGGATIGPDNGGAINPINIAPSGNTGQTVFTTNSNVAPAVTLFGGIPSADLQVFVQALNENQYMRILAEPSLVALSGQDASFLAGGEFPIPVVQSVGVSASTSISIDYKEFGVRLQFRPTVLGDGTIRLHLRPKSANSRTVPAPCRSRASPFPRFSPAVPKPRSNSKAARPSPWRD